LCSKLFLGRALARGVIGVFQLSMTVLHLHVA